MARVECEDKLRDLIIHAWDQEVSWPQIQKWTENFTGQSFDADQEQDHGLFALTRFMYFGRRLVRELLKALYRDHFESPLMQRIRRNYGEKSSVSLIRSYYETELSSTRFIGVGNPAESGAHLLYYFRQVNHLPKDLFTDLWEAFVPHIDRTTGNTQYARRDGVVNRYVFFDDLVGSGTQTNQYLSSHLSQIRKGNPNLDIRFMSLFATTQGLEKLNEKSMFDGKAICLFELDKSFKAFEPSSRYFSGAPSWFNRDNFRMLAETYGALLQPFRPLGYKDGQLLLGFSHNTPDNTLPIFWDEGTRVPWSPAFARYDKK